MRGNVLACSMRRVRSHVRRKAFYSRPYNGQAQGPHTTYFQQPPEPPKPPRRIFRTILFGTTCICLGAYAHSWLFGLPILSVGEMVAEELMESGEELMDALAASVQDTAARQVPAMDFDRAQKFLELRSGYSVTPKAVSHTCQLPSNLPCEDTEHTGAYTFFNDPKKDWCTFSIFDGHAGSRTSQLLKEFLPSIVGSELWRANCMDRLYRPNDSHIVRTIQRAFMKIDHDIMQDAAERVKAGEGALPHTVAIIAAALSGSCALFALFDPANSVLRVANTGDSRAVLGRWDDASGRYVALPMSIDQTGFNQDEFERLKREHPDEESIDPKTGRVHGIAVSRAFGDSRWKWPNELSQLVHEKFWGPAPRPNGVIKTPPYLTAEPDVIETKVQAGAKPDFLIMASDGLWDNMSSEDAVMCVDQWLQKNEATNFLKKPLAPVSLTEVLTGNKSDSPPSKESKLPEVDADDDTYYDALEGAMKWRFKPKYIVNEDENCGVHLVKNALGGNRRNLFLGVMSVQPPQSRKVRDDITVHVVFFGVDAEDLVKKYEWGKS